MKLSPLLKYAFSLGILLLLIYFVNFSELWEALSKLSIASVVSLLVISVALIWVSSVKWGLFVHALGSKVRVARLFALYLLGYFINTLLPSQVGGDAVRTFYVGKQVGHHQAAAATILERLTGLIAMVIFSLLSLFLVPALPRGVFWAVILVALGLTLIVAMAFSVTVLDWCAKIPGCGTLVPHLKKIQGGMQLGFTRPRLLTNALLLSFFYHTLTVVNTMIAAWAVGWDAVPALSLFTVLPLIFLIGAIPIAPNGLGIQEGAFLYFLTGIGATPAEALGVGVVLRAKIYFLALCGGIVWLREKGGAAASCPQTELPQPESTEGNSLS
jgi:glycosyltransferase 2 family protein